VGRIGREDEESLGWGLMEEFIASRHTFLIWKWRQYHKIKKARIEAYNVIPTATSLIGSIYLYVGGGLKIGSLTPQMGAPLKRNGPSSTFVCAFTMLGVLQIEGWGLMGLVVVDGRKKAETIRQIHRFLL